MTFGLPAGGVLKIILVGIPTKIIVPPFKLKLTHTFTKLDPKLDPYIYPETNIPTFTKKSLHSQTDAAIITDGTHALNAPNTGYEYDIRKLNYILVTSINVGINK